MSTCLLCECAKAILSSVSQYVEEILYKGRVKEYVSPLTVCGGDTVQRRGVLHTSPTEEAGACPAHPFLEVQHTHCKTDEAHVSHNFKFLESGPMTNLLQTSKSQIGVLKFPEFWTYKTLLGGMWLIIFS
jgi:hypothetical protein